MTAQEQLPLAKIDASNRLRKTLPVRVEALAEDIGQRGLLAPIEVVGPLNDDDAYRLIYGAHRLAAAKLLGWDSIPAAVHAPDAFADEAEARLREIRENLIRFELNALERAVSVAAWRDLYEAAQGKVTRGRKKLSQDATISEGDPRLQAAQRFADTFSEAAQSALGLNRDAIYRSLKIATVPENIRDRIAESALANNQSELLKLADQSPDRQAQIVGMILAEPPMAATVDAAIAVLDKTPAPRKFGAWEKLSDTFSRLKKTEQHRFFEAHREAVELWLAERG